MSIKIVEEKIQKNIDEWLQGPYDQASKNEILNLQQSNPEELIDAFYTKLAFGTGGLRAPMGVGTNRMNEYTVSAATQGLANYLHKQYPEIKDMHVLIGYDTRKHSQTFAQMAASVLAANGIKVFLFDEFRPVALISYGILHNKCQAGIMITASHNPPSYNGYKVYGSHGGQVIAPHDEGIIAEVNKITTPNLIKKISLPNPYVVRVGPEIDQDYFKEIHKLQLYPKDNATKGSDLHIVYTPLHGSGVHIIPKALKSWGFNKMTIIEEQETTDGTFSTIKSPNPEERATLAMGVATLNKIHGDILLATDPDVDRLAVVAMHENEPFYFNGNEIASMALEHICHALKAQNSFPPKPTAIKTIVTTELFKAIADHYKVSTLDVLTGFKYVGEKIAEWEKESLKNVSAHHFLFGAEESYGMLLGTQSRDKDAVIASCLFSELALQLKLQGKTLVDFLYSIYQKYGVYREKLWSVDFAGKQGHEMIEKLMTKLRVNPPEKLGDTPIEILEDYQSRTKHIMKSGHKEPLMLPQSNVLRFFLTDHTKIVIRPSGTEPKIKIYIGCYEKHFLLSKKEIEKTIKDVDAKVDMYLSWMKRIFYPSSPG